MNVEAMRLERHTYYASCFVVIDGEYRVEGPADEVTAILPPDGGYFSPDQFGELEEHLDMLTESNDLVRTGLPIEGYYVDDFGNLHVYRFRLVMDDGSHRDHSNTELVAAW